MMYSQQQQHHHVNSSQPCSSFEYAIQLNNEAVRQTVAGNDRDAVTLFSKAFSVFQTMIVATRLTGTPFKKKWLQKLGLKKKKNKPAAEHFSPLHLHSSKMQQLPHLKRSFALFNKLITFAPCTKKEDDPCDASVYLIYCTAILFNTGLVYHRQAILGHQDVFLRKAELHYERIFELIPAETASQGQFRCSIGMAVRKGALTNLCQILSKKSESDLKKVLGGDLTNKSQISGRAQANPAAA